LLGRLSGKVSGKVLPALEGRMPVDTGGEGFKELGRGFKEPGGGLKELTGLSNAPRESLQPFGGV
jgi:hypothetical protein